MKLKMCPLWSCTQSSKESRLIRKGCDFGRGDVVRVSAVPNHAVGRAYLDLGGPGCVLVFYFHRIFEGVVDLDLYTL